MSSRTCILTYIVCLTLRSHLHGIQCFHFFLVFSSSLVLRDDGKTVGGETAGYLFQEGRFF